MKNFQKVKKWNKDFRNFRKNVCRHLHKIFRKNLQKVDFLGFLAKIVKNEFLTLSVMFTTFFSKSGYRQYQVVFAIITVFTVAHKGTRLTSRSFLPLFDDICVFLNYKKTHINHMIFRKYTLKSTENGQNPEIWKTYKAN